MTVSREVAVVEQEPELPLQVTPADMAWMAGVIDLKGSVIRKNNKTRKTPQIVLYVQTKNERVAMRLAALTGTAPEQHAAPRADAFYRRGCSQHCPSPHVHVRDDYQWSMPKMTRWTVTGIAAAVVLVNLAPFMSMSDAYTETVAEIVRDFAAEGQGSGMVRSALSRLSALGWQVPAAVTVRMANGA